MTNDTPTRRRLPAVALTALALAVGLPAGVALAGSGGDGGDPAAPGATIAPTQQQEQERQAPDRQAPHGRDCPERERGEGGQDGASTRL